MQRHVDSCGDPGSGDHFTVLDPPPVRDVMRAQPLKLLRETPVGRGIFALEQPGSRQDQRTGAHGAGYLSTLASTLHICDQ
jgi:hypothetical protein